MKGGFLMLFVICAFASAMIARDRRALPSEEQLANTEAGDRICAFITPCAWTVYKIYKKMIEYNLTNSYCRCSPDTVCRVYEDDPAISTSVHRCMPELNENENAES